MRSYKRLLATTLFFSATLAHAEEPGFYVGASLGQAEQSIDPGQGILVTFVNSPPAGPNFPQIIQPDSRRVDGKDLAINATLGYRINKYFAGELSYVDLGETEVREQYSVGLFQGAAPVTIDRKLTSKVSGPAVSALGSYPLTDALSVSLRAGVLFADQEIDQPGLEQTFGDEVWLAGIGVSYSFAKRWTARLEYQRSDDLDDTMTSGETRLEQWLLTALYRL